MPARQETACPDKTEDTGKLRIHKIHSPNQNSVAASATGAQTARNANTNRANMILAEHFRPLSTGAHLKATGDSGQVLKVVLSSVFSDG